MIKSRIRDLPRGVGVCKTGNGKGGLFWRVRLGKKFTGGPIIKRNFPKLSDAREWIFGGASKERTLTPSVIEIENSAGAAAFALTPSQITEATAAFKRLDGLASLTAAVSYFLKHANPTGGRRTVDACGGEFLQTRKVMGIRESTLSQYESYLRTINERFGARPVNEIRASEIEDWLADSSWSKRTRNNYLGMLSTLFLFAKGREYCAENPAERIPRAILDDTPPGILTPPQVRALLEVTRKEDPEMIPFVAIGLFAGLRRSEICSLEWSEVDLQSRMIEVKGIKAKTRQRRLVTIPDVLLAWLKIAPKMERPTPSKNDDVCGERLSRLYGRRLDEKGKVIREAVVSAWPHNALRHSFGSYFYAKFQDENKTAAEMGNSPAVVFRHYRALVRAEEALKFWKTFPCGN